LIGLRAVGLEDGDWIHLAQDGPVVGCCECGSEISSSVKDGGFLD